MSKILIVDDEPAVRQVLHLVCKRQGYFVDSVESGPEAVEKIQHTDYDLVIKDMKMIPMSGAELAEIVRVTSPQTKIMALSGYSTKEMASRAEQAGVDCYIIKPFNRDQFVQAVNQLAAAA